MNDFPSLLSMLLALAFLAQIGMALAALGRTIYLGWRSGSHTAFAFLRQAIIASLPSLATLLVFLGIFITMDPLWPLQDAPPELEAAYWTASTNADRAYRLAGVANLFACLWSLTLLRKTWRRTLGTSPLNRTTIR